MLFRVLPPCASRGGQGPVESRTFPANSRFWKYGLKQHIETLLSRAIAQLIAAGELPADAAQTIEVERARSKEHGDFASNIALVLAKPARLKPRVLAERLMRALPRSERILKTEIAGPGFINFFLSASALHETVGQILAQGEDYGRSRLGQNRRVQVEFVSANPNGPLHVGHGRGAAYGAAVADLLAAVGYDVHREYYVNDAGRQMDILAVSVWLSCCYRRGGFSFLLIRYT